jgi:hypothetical protein
VSVFHCEKNGRDHRIPDSDCRCLFVMSSFTHIIICLIPRSQNEYRKNFQRTASWSLMRLTISVGHLHMCLILDNVCIESLSIDLFDDTLKKATRGVTNLEKKIEKYILALKLLTR